MKDVGEALLFFIKSSFPKIEVLPINLSQIVFEEKIRLLCFSCKNYGIKWTCPGHLPNLNYRKIVEEFEHRLILKIEMPFDANNFSTIRGQSTNILHRTLLSAERFLYDNDVSLRMSFIGGSCKLCKNTCNPEHCNNPQSARIPMEATGINVVKTMKNIGIDVCFPPKNVLSRYGMLLWD